MAKLFLQEDHVVRANTGKNVALKRVALLLGHGAHVRVASTEVLASLLNLNCNVPLQVSKYFHDFDFRHLFFAL